MAAPTAPASCMPFFDTHPANIDRLDPSAVWARFRTDDRRRVLKSLHALCHGDAPITIGLPQGPTLAATLWSVDEPAAVLHFTTASNTPLPAELASAPRLWAVAYDDEVKVQFELRRFIVERAPDKQLLHAVLPASLYALPRRGDVRVRPTDKSAPKVRFRHPLDPERWTQMRAIDLGAKGCALWRPMDALPLSPGLELEQAEIELDEKTLFYADLRVQHVTLAPSVGAHGPAPDASGVRVGCRWSGLAPVAEAALGQWMKSGQRRKQRLSLDFGG